MTQPNSSPSSPVFLGFSQLAIVDVGQAMFNSMDTDHDDVIAYSEFLAAALQVFATGIVLIVFDGGIIHNRKNMESLECEKE